MNHSDDPEYVEALNQQFDVKVIDGELYLPVSDLNVYLDKMALIIIQNQHELCQHGIGVANWILMQLSGVLDTSTVLNAGQLIPDFVPEDFADGLDTDD